MQGGSRLHALFTAAKLVAPGALICLVHASFTALSVSSWVLPDVPCPLYKPRHTYIPLFSRYVHILLFLRIFKVCMFSNVHVYLHTYHSTTFSTLSARSVASGSYFICLVHTLVALGLVGFALSPDPLTCPLLVAPLFCLICLVHALSNRWPETIPNHIKAVWGLCWCNSFGKVCVTFD